MINKEYVMLKNKKEYCKTGEYCALLTKIKMMYVY